MDVSNEKTWDQTTTEETGKKKPFLMQHLSRADPVVGSRLEPWVQTDHAWTDDQARHMNEETWDKETETRIGRGKPWLQKAQKNALSQNQNGQGYFRVETKSYIDPYIQRDHAWNHAHLDNTNVN